MFSDAKGGGGEQYFLICWSFDQVCGNGLLEGGCMTQEKLAKHKDEQVNTSFPILEPTICADWQEPGKGEKLSHLLGFLKVPSCQVSFTWSINYYSTSVTIQCIPMDTLQNVHAADGVDSFR